MRGELRRQWGRWLLLTAVTVIASVGFSLLHVPSAALFAALVVGIALALSALAPRAVPRRAGLAAQGVLGVYIGTMVASDALGALAPHWPIVTVVVVGTLLLSAAAGVLMGLHREVTPLTGALALVAGGASGLVAIARELGGDDRVVAVVQYLRVGIVTASMPLVVTLIFAPDRSHPAMLVHEEAAPWYLGCALIAVVGQFLARLVRLPGAGLLGPMFIAVVLELCGLSLGLAVPVALVQISYAIIGWQAGLAFTRESLRSIGRAMPLAVGLIMVLTALTAGLGVLLSHATGMSALEGYLATSPGGIYAVLATAVETGSDVTFIVAAQVLRVLVMLFAAPVLARAVVALQRRFGRQSREITAESKEPIAVAD